MTAAAIANMSQKKMSSISVVQSPTGGLELSAARNWWPLSAEGSWPLTAPSAGKFFFIVCFQDLMGPRAGRSSLRLAGDSSSGEGLAICLAIALASQKL